MWHGGDERLGLKLRQFDAEPVHLTTGQYHHCSLAREPSVWMTLICQVGLETKGPYDVD